MGNSAVNVNPYIAPFTGDSGSGGAAGLVPAPAVGDAATGKFLKANGGWAAPSAASDTASGVVELAVQSEMEAGSDTTRAVTPGRQHYHPSAAKAWIDFVTTAGPSISTNASYGMNSVARSGAGSGTGTLAVAMSSAAFSCACSGNAGSGHVNAAVVSTTQFNWTCRITTSGANLDSDHISVHVFGDQ